MTKYKDCMISSIDHARARTHTHTHIPRNILGERSMLYLMIWHSYFIQPIQLYSTELEFMIFPLPLCLFSLRILSYFLYIDTRDHQLSYSDEQYMLSKNAELV